MTYQELITHFGSGANAAASLAKYLKRPVPRQSIHRWKRVSMIPMERQIEYEQLTDGALRADLSEETRAVLSRGRATPTPEPADA